MTDAYDASALLRALQAQHRTLDEAIAHYTGARCMDDLSLRRMKKQKLRLKEQIECLRSQLIPDLDA